MIKTHNFDFVIRFLPIIALMSKTKHQIKFDVRYSQWYVSMTLVLANGKLVLQKEIFKQLYLGIFAILASFDQNKDSFLSFFQKRDLVINEKREKIISIVSSKKNSFSFFRKNTFLSRIFFSRDP